MLGVKLFSVERLAKNKIQLIRQPAGVSFKFEGHVQQKIIFSGVRGLDGQKIIATFNQIAAIVDGIIDGIEAETARILRERG
jgi:hypothetical protein